MAWKKHCLRHLASYVQIWTFTLRILLNMRMVNTQIWALAAKCPRQNWFLQWAMRTGKWPRSDCIYLT